MKLPTGNKLFEYEGGEKNLKECLETIRKKGLDGYLVVTSAEGDTLVTGEIVFNKGVPALAEVVVGGEARSSDSSLQHILKHAVKPGAKMEFREIIAVDPLLDLLEDKRLKGEVSLEDVLKKIREEQKRKEEEEKKRREMLDELKKVVEGGFSLPSLGELKNAPFKDVEAYYKRIKDVLKKYEKILEEIQKVDEPSLEEVKRDLIKLLKSPEESEVVEEKYREFKERVEALKEKRAKLEKWIEEWKRQGYVTTLLEKKLKENIDEASALFVDFLDRLQRVKELEKELKELLKEEKFQPFINVVKVLDRKLKDPSKVEEASAELEDLKKAAEEDFAHKEEVRKKIEELDMLGLDTSYARELLKKKWEDIKEEWDQYEKNANLLISLRKKMEELREEAERDLKGVWESAFKKMVRPDDIEDAQKAFQEFMDALKSIREERKALQETFKKMVEEGYVLSRLLPGEDAPLDELREVLRKITELKERSERLRQELGELDLKFFPGRGDEIEKLSMDLAEVEKAEKALEELKREVEEDQRFRKEVEEEVSKREGEGYNVEKIKQALSAPPTELKEAFEDFTKRVAAAEKFLKGLDDLDTTYFKEDVELIKDLVRDLYSMEDAKEALEGLKEKLKAFAQEREKLSSTLKELEKEGWKVEGYKMALSGSPEDVKDALKEVFERKVAAEEHLKEIEGWDPLESSHMKEVVEEVKASLKDLKNLEEATKRMEEVSEKIKNASERRKEIKAKVKEWLDSGYLVESLNRLLEAPLEKLEEAFSDMEERIDRLEQLQLVLDSLDTRHFVDEVEDLIFMNDPSRVEEFEKRVAELKEKIEKDKKRREDIRRDLERLFEEGFGKAREVVEKYLEEDLSILEMHYKDFLKDVKTLKELMEKTGFKIMERKTPSRMGILPDRESTLENFLVDESNLVAFEGVKSAIEGETPLLYMYGPSGVGKTHLINAAANELERRGKAVALTTGEKFVEEFLNAVKSDTLDDFREFYRGADALLVDNVEFLAGKETSQEEFFHLLENMKEGGVVILTSDRPPGELPETAEKLINRFQSGIVAEIGLPTEEVKKGFIKRWLEREGLSLNEEQLNLLTKTENLMALKGILTTLKRAATIGEISDDIIKDVLSRSTALAEEHDEIMKAFSSLKEKVLSLAEETEEGVEEEGSSEEEEAEEEVMVKCSVCGEIIPETATVCPHCGTVFEESVELLICPHCNAEIPMDSEVCPSCGASLH